MSISLKPTIRNLLCATALSSLLANAHAAVTINWGNSPALPTVNFDSGGVALTDSGFTFELGVFDFGTPLGDESTWRNQWTVVDTPASGYNQGLQTFQEIWNAPDNSLAGRQASIWIHNGDFSATEDSEWSIFTADDWIIPDMGDQRNTPLEFRVTDLPQTDELLPADTIIFGGLFGNQGSGEISVPLVGSIIQTATFVIPEPSSIVLAALGGIFLLGRRRG